MSSNILFVYKEEYPWDIRVEKITQSLKHQYDVSILCRNTKKEPIREVIEGVTIYRLPKLSLVPDILRKTLNFTLFINPIWAFKLFTTIIKTKSKLVIVRDLPLMPITILICKILRRKVIFDMAECYPLMYESYAQFKKQSFTEKVFKNSKAAKYIENISVKYADYIWVMIEESRNRFIHLPEIINKTSIVSNTPILDTEKTGATHSGTDLRIAYVGFLTPLRGLDILIRAIAIYISNASGGSNIRLDIVGKGEARNDLIELVESLKLEEHVFIHGWLEQRDVDNILKNANIGTLTYRVCSHWNHTIPNKIFDYMLCGLPVIATDVIPIERILSAEKCGLVGKEDPASIAQCLVQLRDPTVRQLLGENGRNAIIARYNWNNEIITMLRSIQEIS